MELWSSIVSRSQGVMKGQLVNISNCVFYNVHVRQKEQLVFPALDPPRTPRTSQDLLAPPRTSQGPRTSQDLLEPPRASQDLLGPPSTAQDFLRPPRTSQHLLGPPRTSQDLLGRTTSQDLLGPPRTSQDLIGPPRTSLGQDLLRPSELLQTDLVVSG